MCELVHTSLSCPKNANRWFMQASPTRTMLVHATGSAKKAPLLLAGPRGYACSAGGWVVVPPPRTFPIRDGGIGSYDGRPPAVIPGKGGNGVVAKRARLVVMPSTRHITNIKTSGPAHCTAQARRRLSDRFLFLEGGTEYEYEAKRPFCVRESANRRNAQSAKGTSGNI